MSIAISLFLGKLGSDIGRLGLPLRCTVSLWIVDALGSRYGVRLLVQHSSSKPKALPARAV